MSAHSFKLIVTGTFALVALLTLPTIARAQDAVTEPVTAQVTIAPPTAAAAALDGPRLQQAGIARRSLDAAAAPAPMKAAGDRRDVAWMVVGGAALVVGSMIGGDGGTIIMITGGVIGLVGLMRYLQ